MVRSKEQPFEEPAADAQARRVRLADLVKGAGGASAVALRSAADEPSGKGIDRVHLQKLYSESDNPVNRKDILRLSADSARMLIRGLGLSDVTVIHELNIPELFQERWRLPAQPSSTIEPIVLPHSVGLTLPAGTLLSVETTIHDSGLQLVSLQPGEYRVLPVRDLPAHAVTLGRVVAVDTSVPRGTPAPASSRQEN